MNYPQSEWRDLGVLESKFKGKVFDVGDDEVWVFKEAGIFKAISNICPHKMGPLSEGLLENGVIECPWHGFSFDVCSGNPVSRPCMWLRTYEVKIENSHIFITGKRQ